MTEKPPYVSPIVILPASLKERVARMIDPAIWADFDQRGRKDGAPKGEQVGPYQNKRLDSLAVAASIIAVVEEEFGQSIGRELEARLAAARATS